MTKAKVVIDTNILLVANRQHEKASDACVTECIHRLMDIKNNNGVVVIDNGSRIVNEYQNKTNYKKGKGVGDVFLKSLMRDINNTTRVQQVTITETTENEFVEFPGPQLQAQFDAADRKFVAVANAHQDKPPIWQAVDCKWLDWWPALLEQGIKVEFICPNDICLFYKNKFPNKTSPSLPNK